ncbi:MAG: DUF4340 domain-containing protein [Verrucomicrobiales bacterium]
MRFATTAVLAGIAVALAMVIAVVDRKPETGARAAALANVMLRFEPDSIDRIVVESGASKTAMEKHGGLWFFSEPETDRVDPEAVDALLDQLNHLTIVDTIGEEEEGLDQARLGLEGDEAIVVTVSGAGENKGEDRSEHTVVLGAEAPRTNAIYVRRSGDEESYVVDGNPRSVLEQPLAAMRDPRIVGAPVEAIEQLVVRNSTGRIALQRRVTSPRQDWALSEPLQTWADREKLDQLMADLGSLEIDEVVSGEAADEEIPNPLPEDAAVLQMTVYGFEQPITLYLKQVEDAEGDGDAGDGDAGEELPLLEARISDRPAVYRLRSDFLGELPESPNDVRDRRLARIQMEYLDSIVIQSRIDPMVKLRSERAEEGVRWNVEISNKLLPANQGEITALVAAVNDAAIREFVSDSADDLGEYGLAPPARQVVFNLAYPTQPQPDGTPGEVQEMSRVLNLGWKEGDEQRVFANFEGEPHVYELDPSFVSHIPTHPIKWRSLSVLTFNRFHLKSITRELPGREKLKLEYNYRRDEWKAFRNGDEEPGLDTAAASRLRERLGSLTADGWFLSLAQAYEALQTPSASFVIVTTELDRAINESREVTRRINLAPAAAKIYFGQIEGSPDVFFLGSEAYRDLIRPVTGGRPSRR